MDNRSPSLRDLLTILYRPRETMRRILDASGDRWTIQLVVLAYVCTSFSDVNLRGIENILPGLRLVPTMAAFLLVMLLSAAVWAGILYLFSWLIAVIARLLGGTAPLRDVRAALAWSLVPMVWSVIYRLPMAFYRNRFDVSGGRTREAVINFLAHGGCTLLLLVTALQLLLAVWLLFVASSTVAEAERFSTAKGFGTLALCLVAPVLIGIAAAVAFRH